MKLLVSFLIVMTTACSHTSRDTVLSLVGVAPWEVQDLIEDFIFSTPCASSEVTVSIRKLASSDGKIYSFLLVPIGNADVLDQPYRGFDVFVRYPSPNFSCGENGVYLIAEGGTEFTATATGIPGQLASCSYKFKPPLRESGHFLLHFKNAEYCNIPDLNINYKSVSRHHYDSISG